MIKAMILDSIFKLGAGKKLQWEESQQCYVLLYPEGMVKLNETAREIIAACDGKKTVKEVIQFLQEKFNEPDLENEIIIFLEDAHAKHWITK